MKKNLIGIKRLALRGKFFLLAIVLAVSTTVGVLQTSKPVHAAIGSVTQYTIAPTGGNLRNLTVGPDGNIWYTGAGPTISSRIGKLTMSGVLTDYPNRATGANPKSPRAITQGSDGNIWYSEYLSTTGTTQIIKLSTTGVVLGIYPFTGGIPMSMILGPDGAVWYGNSSGVGKITTSGVITHYPSGNVTSLTSGPDGNIWYTTTATGTTVGNDIRKITTSGTITAYPLGVYNAQPWGITTGPDGNLWFTESYTRKIGMITTSGVITRYAIPPTGPAPEGITTGSDGALWFTLETKIGRLSTSGVYTEYAVTGGSQIEHIVSAPDGAVWFVQANTGKIGRMATQLTNQTVSFTSTAPVGANLDSAAYTPSATATSGLPVAITVDPSASTVCSIDGSGNVSYQAAGTCILNANQGGNVDYNPAPQVQQSFNVLPVNADTSVALSCPASVTLGSTVTCTITIANSGPADAENVSLTALFSNSLTGASISGGGTLSGQYITWTTPSLTSSTSTTITFSATASTVGKVQFSAALLQTSPDPVISDNIVNTTIIVL